MRNATRDGIGALSLAVLLMAHAGCSGDEFQGPAAEVPQSNVKLDLPPVPQFKMPEPYPDGSHSVAEMRLKGNKYLDTEVTVTGYVIWMYDCATAIRTPEMTDKDVERLLKEEPERCTRPNLYLGDKPDDPVNRGIWVVDIPRPPREDEKKVLPKEDLAAWPEVPEFKVGQHVKVTGTWALKSPQGFGSSTGLLVYKSMQDLDAPSEGDGN
ncbi:MAG: hypothetical protein D6689_14880 [Deltaproteobacteria bacterium]|nr:MAG: hypothetical protein D6689_14880 [Deltaproteobacteria bacterium]